MESKTSFTIESFDSYALMMESGTLAHRVARRYLAKAKGVSLMPEYTAALTQLEQGDPKPLVALGKKIIEIIIPGGGNIPAPWYGALGTTKRNALKELRRDILNFDGLAANIERPTPNTRSPEWLAYTVYEAKRWARAIRTLELASVIADEEREIKHGHFTVIPVPGLSKGQVDGAFEALDAATDKIRSKFPQVLYGKVFFATSLGRKNAAHYVYADDTVHLSVTAAKRFGDIYTICHEFGHRFDHKFLARDLKNEFWKLSTQKVHEIVTYDAKLREGMADEVVHLAKERALGKELPKFSTELLAWLKSVDGPADIRKSIGEFLTGKIDEQALHTVAKGTKDALVYTGKVLREPLAVTPYGATKPAENFAEAFAHYVLGMTLAPEFVEILSKAH